MVDLRLDRLHAGDVGQHLGAAAFAQQLLGDGACGHPAHGLPRAGAAAADPGADPVLALIGVVGVRGAVGAAHLLVVLRLGVGVAHQHRDRRAQRAALEHPGQDLRPVRLAALGGQRALPRAPAVQLGLQIRLGQLQQGRAAVDHRADGRAVRLAEGGDPEQVPEGVAHGARWWPPDERAVNRRVVRTSYGCYRVTEVERMSVAEARSERIEVRTTPSVKALLQRAASASHKNVTEFLLDAGLSVAEDTLANRRLFRLDDQQWQEFQDLLDRPVSDKPRLARLMAERSVLE